MLSWIREKFGKVFIGGIISFIAFVFVFYGVFSPKSTRGLHEGAVAGTVNGDSISIAEFNHELNRRMEFFKKIAGGNISEEQIKAFRLKEGVFQELANRKILIQEAQRQKMLPSDEEIREKIQEIPAFQKDGKFDLASYKQVLEANNHSAGSFERLVRDDLSAQQWDAYIRNRIHVAPEELVREFKLSQDKRKIKYVLLTTEAAMKSISVGPTEVDAFLKDPTKLNLAKAKFEDEKGTTYKGQTFEAAKQTVARNILASGKMDEIQKLNQKLADEVSAIMTADKSSDAKINALLKTNGVEVKTSDFISHQSSNFPGVGEAKDLMNDAFSSTSPISAKSGGKPKKYLLAGRVLVALCVDEQKSDLSQFEKEKEQLTQQIIDRKSRLVYQEWSKKLMAKAKIEMNPAVVGSSE